MVPRFSDSIDHESIVGEILIGLQNDVLNFDNFRKQIQNIYENVNGNDIHFPEYFVNGFTILFALDLENQDSIDDLLHFHDSFTLVYLTPDIDESTRYRYLSVLLAKISESIDSLKCFQLTYKSLQIKHERQYLSSINERTIDPDFKIKYYEIVYDFLVIVYTMCFEASEPLDYISEMPSIFISAEHQTSYAPIIDILRDIQYYMIIIIKKRTSEIGLLKMANNIVSLLVNIPNTLIGVHKSYIVRLVDIIMKILMSRGLQYCTPKNSNCILHHHINRFDLKNNEMIK